MVIVAGFGRAAAAIRAVQWCIRVPERWDVQHRGSSVVTVLIIMLITEKVKIMSTKSTLALTYDEDEFGHFFCCPMTIFIAKYVFWDIELTTKFYFMYGMPNFLFLSEASTLKAALIILKASTERFLMNKFR